MPMSDRTILKSAGALVFCSPSGRPRGSACLILCIGEPSEAESSLLDEGLVQGYLSMNFTEIGRGSYRVLQRLAQGGSVPMKTLIDSRIYLPRW